MLRIVGGIWRGRQIRAPKGDAARPTSERVREALFGVLEARTGLDGLRACDLYAGSGALGIEALSRGCRHVTFVEALPRHAALIRANLETLQVPPERWQVVTQKAEPWLRQQQILREPGGLVLLDPPYASGEAERILARVAQSETVAPGTLIVVEAAARAEPALPAGLDRFQSKRYGDTVLWFLCKAVPAPQESR